jgi:hypothetical protein
MAKIRYESTFALPDAYQQQAAEARRRRRMAEMLAQQAYQPGDIQNAPIPAAAPLVQGLQAYLTARAARKSDEAEESAKETASREAREFLNTLTRPREDFDKTMDLKEVLQIGTPELVDGQLKYPDTFTAAPNLQMIPQAGPQVQLGRKPEDDQVYMPAPVSRFTATGRETDPKRMAAMLANPQFKSGFTDEQLLEQRRNLALEGMLTSENPLVQKVAGAIYPTLQPEKAKLQTAAVNLKDLTPASARRFAASGDPQDIEYAVEPTSTSGLTTLSKLYAERNALIAKNPNDPFIKTLDSAIAKEITPARGATVNVTNRYGAPMSAVDEQGNPVLIQPSQIGGPPSVVKGFTPTPSNAKPMTEGESNSATFADRMAISLPELDRAAPSRISTAVAGAPYGLGTESVPEKDQTFFQAKDDFIAAVLRKESGAAIGANERADAEKQYIPQPGDKPAVLAQKKRAREAAFVGMQRAAGQSYKPTTQVLPQSAKDMGVTQQDWNAMTPEQRKLFN